MNSSLPSYPFHDNAEVDKVVIPVFPWAERLAALAVPQILVLGPAHERHVTISSIVHLYRPSLSIPKLLVCASEQAMRDCYHEWVPFSSRSVFLDEVHLEREFRAGMRQSWILDGCFLSYHWARSEWMRWLGQQRTKFTVVGLPSATPFEGTFAYSLIFLIPPLSKRDIEKVAVECRVTDLSWFLERWNDCCRRNHMLIVERDQEGPTVVYSYALSS
jgi:hypothetical protein